MKRARSTTSASSHARLITISNSQSLSATPRFLSSLLPLPLSFLSIPVPTTIVCPSKPLFQSSLPDTPSLSVSGNGTLSPPLYLASSQREVPSPASDLMLSSLPSHSNRWNCCDKRSVTSSAGASLKVCWRRWPRFVSSVFSPAYAESIRAAVTWSYPLCCPGLPANAVAALSQLGEIGAILRKSAPMTQSYKYRLQQCTYMLSLHSTTTKGGDFGITSAPSCIRRDTLSSTHEPLFMLLCAAETIVTLFSCPHYVPKGCSVR